MEYINDLELCNSTYIVGGLLVLSLVYNFIPKNQEVEDNTHLELEMTPQQVIPVENAETQTLPIENEDEMFTEQMRNYMMRNSRDVVDVKIDLDHKRRKYSV